MTFSDPLPDRAINSIAEVFSISRPKQLLTKRVPSSPGRERVFFDVVVIAYL
jgi:hypothetical protein